MLVHAKITVLVKLANALLVKLLRFQEELSLLKFTWQMINLKLFYQHYD